MKLASIEAEVHVFDGIAKLDQPIRLLLKPEDIPPIRISLGSDGETMVIDRHPLSAVDMAEHGRTEIFDLTDRLDGSLRYSTIESLWTIDAGGCSVGLALKRANQSPFCFWNWGDEFAWGDEITMLGFQWLSDSQPRLSVMLTV